MKIRLIETLSKSDEERVREIARKIVKDETPALVDGDKKIEKSIEDIVIQVLQKYHKTLWMQRSTWSKQI